MTTDKRKRVTLVRAGWTLDQALDVVRKIESAVSKFGWHVGLTGSTLLSGQSSNDLDIILYPHKSVKSWRPFADSLRYDLGLAEMHSALESIGMRRAASADAVRDTWSERGEKSDDKHVEIWRLDGRKIDIFVMR